MVTSEIEKLPAKPKAPTPGAHAKPAHSQPLSTRLVEPGQVAEYEAEWSRLAGSLAVPNAFYEPWTILPALQHLGDCENVRFLLVYGAPDKRGHEPLLGFFPLEIRSRCLGLPIRSLAFWQHRYCFLAVPLIAAGQLRPVLDAFWRWFERNPLGCRVLDTNHLLAEGTFHEIWADFAIGRSSLLLNDYPRAFLDPRRSARPYSSVYVSKKHMDEYLRQERRLRELGTLEFQQVEDAADVDAWIDEFLQLEAAGWKGDDGGAFGLRQEDSEYLRTVTREGFMRKRVMLLSLRLNGKAIAMKHNLLCADGSFAFKIAFDESYYKYSPGALLEFENIRRISDSELPWMDSCAVARHPMANRLWNERRMIRRTLFSDSSRLGDFFVSALPLLRWISKQVRPRPIPDYLRISTHKELK